MRTEILNLIYRLCDEGKIASPVLDVGGAGTEYQKEQGYDFKEYFNSKGIHYDLQDIRNVPGADFICDFATAELTGKYRTILCTEMLEHCEDPAGVIRNCYKHLKESGLIVVTVPDIYHIHCAEDYYRFSENGLKMLCKQFKELEFGHFGQEDKNNYEHYFVGLKAREKGDLNA